MNADAEPTEGQMRCFNSGGNSKGHRGLSYDGQSRRGSYGRKNVLEQMMPVSPSVKTLTGLQMRLMGEVGGQARSTIW